jgi:imidazoleglycerol phosphate dehydratase HisB
MHLEVTPEVIMTQLGYSRSDKILNQIEKIISNTKGFSKFAKHIISLNDSLKHIDSYVALSNSVDYFKIKCEQTNSENIVKEFTEIVEHFANKYNVTLEKVANKEVYYIKGIQ